MNTQIQLRRTLGKGFTLLEMMLVVVIMGVLIGVTAVSILGRGTAAKIGATRASMSTVANAVKQYNLEKSVYPATLNDLVDKFIEKAPLDAWKRPLVYSVSAPGSPHPFMLYSTGPSGDPGNADNIDYWVEDDAAPASR